MYSYIDYPSIILIQLWEKNCLQIIFKITYNVQVLFYVKEHNDYLAGNNIFYFRPILVFSCCRSRLRLKRIYGGSSRRCNCVCKFTNPHTLHQFKKRPFELFMIRRTMLVSQNLEKRNFAHTWWNCGP